jgi:hypothetical protein
MRVERVLWRTDWRRFCIKATVQSQWVIRDLGLGRWHRKGEKIYIHIYI